MYSNRDRISNIGPSQDLSKADRNLLNEKRKQEMEQSSAYREFNDAKNKLNQKKKRKKALEKNKLGLEEEEKNIFNAMSAKKTNMANYIKNKSFLKATIEDFFNSDESLDKELDNIRKRIGRASSEIARLDREIRDETLNLGELEKKYNKEREDVKNITKLATESHKKGVEAENLANLKRQAEKEINRLNKVIDSNKRMLNYLWNRINSFVAFIKKNSIKLSEMKEDLEKIKKETETLGKYDSNISSIIANIEKDINELETNINTKREALGKNNKERNKLVEKNNTAIALVASLNKNNNNYQNLTKSIEAAKKIA